MKFQTTFISIAALFIGSTLGTLAQEAQTLPANVLPAAEEAKSSSAIYIVVVDNVSPRSSNMDMFVRIKKEFTKAFSKESWGQDVQVERFGFEVPENAQELRIFFKSLRSEQIDDLTFRAWVTYHKGGEKVDLGVIKAKLYPRAGQDTSSSLDQVIAEAAKLTTRKLNKEVFN